jgi:hypothetical protein
MKKPYYIIAGNYGEYIRYVNQHCMEFDLNTTQVIFLNNIIMLNRKMRLPDAQPDPDGIFIGTWRTLPDIKDIVIELYSQSIDTKKSDILTKVYQSL